MCSIRVASIRRFGSTRFGRVVVSLKCKLLFAHMREVRMGKMVQGVLCSLPIFSACAPCLFMWACGVEQSGLHGVL